MKTAFAAVLALSLLSGTAMAAPSDMRGDRQGQNNNQGHQGPNNNQGQQGGHQNNNGQHNNGQANAQPPRGNAPQQNHQQSQNNNRGNERHDGGRHDNGPRYGNNDRNGSRDYVYNGRRYQAVRGPVWHAPRGYDAYRGWNRGDRLPAAYRDRVYVIDYRAYGLVRPPYGYQWVRVSNNVMLVNVYNGLISQIVLSMFY